MSYYSLLTLPYRPLFSSLLTALPVEKWHIRDDTYECTEADYIAEVEGDLFHLEGILIKTVFQHIVETRTSLSADKVYDVSSPSSRNINCDVLMGV